MTPVQCLASASGHRDSRRVFGCFMVSRERGRICDRARPRVEVRSCIPTRRRRALARSLRSASRIAKPPRGATSVEGTRARPRRGTDRTADDGRRSSYAPRCNARAPVVDHLQRIPRRQPLCEPPHERAQLDVCHLSKRPSHDTPTPRASAFERTVSTARRRSHARASSDPHAW